MSSGAYMQMVNMTQKEANEQRDRAETAEADLRDRAGKLGEVRLAWAEDQKKLARVEGERDRYQTALYKIASEAAGGEDASDSDECARCNALIETAEAALETGADLEGA